MTIGSTQKYRNSKLHKKTVLVSDWIGIGRSSEFAVSDRIGSEKMVSLHPYKKHIIPHSAQCPSNTLNAMKTTCLNLKMLLSFIGQITNRNN